MPPWLVSGLTEYALCIVRDNRDTKIMHQQRNVLASLTKRRDFDWKHIQSVKKVFAKLIVADHALQIAMRCRN